MKKHKLNLKTKVWHKYVISLGSLVLATSITLGSMYGYSKCSADRTGRKNETDPYYLKNKFVQTNEAKLYFVSGDKSDKVANIIYDKNFGHDGWKVQTIEKIKNQVAKKELDLSEYINNYYNENKHYPILNIKYGSFDFFNEYLEAVSAQDFFDFTRWFMFNVSWGPEIITLKEFSIVKGVEMKGNSITLGSHSDLNKEYMTIKFYPDAFFGTMAVYSELSGRGNASDALVYKINNKLLTSNEIKDLLKNTSAYNAYANMTKKEISAYSFRSIDDIRTLIGSKVYALKKPNWYFNLENNSILDLEKSRFDLANDYLTLINGSNIEEAKTNLKAKLAETTSLDKYNLLSSADFNSLEEKVIAEVSVETNSILNNKFKENYLRISFTDGSYYNLFASMTDFKQITGSALKTETNDIKNIFNIDKAIEFAKNTYEKENVRYNQTFPLINDKLKEFESQLKFNEDDYTNGKKELNDLKAVKEKELNDLKLTDPTSAQIPTLEADLVEINKDLTALETTYTKTKDQLIAKKDNFISKNITLKAKLEAISKNYSELISSTTEQNGNIKAKEEYAKKIFELAKSLQITASGILQSLSLPLKIDDNDLLSEETTISIYHVDLAYLPNQLISRDSLRLISETNYLNWRDFFNIKNFTNSATDENEFYIYSPHFKSFVEEWNKKHNDAKVKLDYNELINDIERIKTEKQVIDKQLSEIDAESKSLEQKSFGYIYLELKEAFLDNETEEKDWNIKNFIMPGTEFANSPLITQKDWGDFCRVNFENLDEYLKIVKTRWNLFYNKYSSFVIAHKDLAKEIEDARVEMEKQKELHPNWTTDWDEYAKIKSYIDAYEAKLKQWKDLKATNPNYVDYVDVNKIAEFNEALNNVLAKSLEHKDKKENYFDLKKKSLQKDMELRLIKFKFNYLTNIVNRTDKNIQDLYLEYIKKFEDEKANLQIFIDEYITNLKNNYDLKQKLVLEKVKNEKDIEIITQLLNKSDADVQKINDLITKYDTVTTKPEIVSKQNEYNQALNDAKEKQRVIDEYKALGIIEANEDQLALYDSFKQKIANITLSNQKLEEALAKVNGACPEEFSNRTTSTSALLNIIKKINEREYELLSKNNLDFSTLTTIEEKLADAEIQDLVVSITTEKINNDIENLIAEINGYKKIYLEDFEELKNTEKSLFEYELKLLELEAIKEKINTDPTLLAELTLIENELNNQKAIYETNFASLLANLQSSYDDLIEKISEYETKTQTLKQLNSQLFEKLNDYYQKSSAITNKYLNNEIKNISEFAKMILDFENNNSEIFNEKFALKALKDKEITLLNATNSFKNSFSNYANVKENLKAKVKSIIEAKLAISKEYTLFEQKINFAQTLINDNIALFRKYNSELAELKSLLSSPSLNPAQRQAIQDLINETEGKISAIRAKVPLIQAQGIDAQNKLKLILDSINEDNLFNLRKLNFALDIEKANYYNSFKEFDDYANEIKQAISNKVNLSNPYDKLNDKLFNGLTSSLLLNKKLLIASEINKEYNADSKYNEILAEKDLIVAKTKIELREKLIKLNLIKKDTLENDPILTKFTRKVSLRNINKENANLLLSFAEKSKVEETFASFSGYSDNILKVSFNANNSTATKKVNEIFALLGYKKVVLPRLVREEGDIKDSRGNIIKGYSLFSDGYENLLDELLDKVPYAAEWLEGEHIEKTIDNNGVIKYELKNGKYLGFTRDSRVGLWSVLKATNPEFKGISIDFLKFVAAHEYGHHMTLNGAQNLGDKAKGNNPIFVSALTPGATPGITNYYNKEALDLYLKARTNLLLTTRTYLNGKYIIDKNGEYPSFIYPHLDGSGNLVYDPAIGEEKEEDIWGTKISDPDILKALKNQSRRFIQNFEGMKKALEERRKALGFNDPNKKGISLFDIWLSNALDTYSGTLNPTVKGEAKYLVFNKTKGIYEFTKASLKILDGILKDGMGNKIKFEEDNSGRISAKIADIEYVKQDLDKGIEGKFIVKEIYVYDKNGQPVISTLLNSDLYKNKEYGPEAVQYVLNKIEEIQKNIESLVVKEFIINGWDDSSTTLSVEPKMSINFRKITDLGKKAEEYNPTKEFYKNYINERDFTSKQMTSKWINDPVYSYENGKPYGKSLQEALSDFNRDDYFCKIDDTTVGAFTKALAKLIISGGWHYLATPYPTSSGFETYIKSTNKSYIANANLDSSFTNNILHEDLGSALEEFGIAKALKPLHMIGYELVGNKINENLWLAYDAANKIVSNFNDPGNAIFNKFININSVKKIKLNTSLLSKNIKDSLFNSIYYNDGTQTLYGEDIEFNDIAKWFEFVSLDLEKGIYDATSHKVNWDLDYVKSKFSLVSFKRSLKITFAQYENTLNDEDKTKIRYLIEQASDQEVANEIIDRYSKSKLAAFTSAFNLKDIQTKNLFWLFDQKIGFGAYKTDKFNLKDPDLSKFEFDKEALVKAIKDFATENDVKEENLTSVDYLVLSNRISLQTEQLYACLVNNRFSLIDILMTFVNGVFKKVSPSQDALNYFNSKNERRFNEFFTDYTYNFAEVINRDNLQITYTPPTTEFGNMPSFLSGISESTTGLEYVVDATYTKKWLDAVIKFDNNGRENNKSLVDAILNYNKAKNKEYENYANAYNLKNNPITLSNKDDFSNGHTFRNSYFGQLQINNNGWFKDRWYREFLDFKLYDDQGKDIQDETIRIKDLEGNRVESRARAYWEYYIQSQGVGKRSMSGIWRDKDKDAIAFYGYIPKHLVDEHDIKYLAFKDKKTGKITTVALNTKDSNNMFYYKEQNINNENIALEDKKNNTNNARHYLAQEKYIWEDSKGNKKAGVGFVSYASDYIIASKYKNSLLLPGHEYEVYFASDVSGTFACEVFLGNTESISENGKTFSQAPTSIRQEKQADGTYKIILKVQDQFNIF